MGKLFRYDGPVVKIGNQIACLLWLNILTFVCSLPVFTMGAAITAMHYVVLKISKDEDPKVTKTWFVAFRKNFKKSTQIWLIYLLAAAALVFDLVAVFRGVISLPMALQVLFVCAALILLVLINWTFILQSRYENTNRRTVKNALLMGILHPIKTVVMLALSVLPPLLWCLFPRISPLVLAFWFSFPAYAQAKLYAKVFRKLEQDSEMEQAEDSTDLNENRLPQP